MCYTYIALGLGDLGGCACGVVLTKKLFLVTTETSGDLLGGRLVAELKEMVKDLQITGVGGEKLLAEGMAPIYQVSDFNVMGLFEVLSQLKRLKAMFKHLVNEVKKQKPDIIVLVDAPDFNLRFAKAVRKLGIPVIYYVSPQVWAWRKGRAKTVAKIVDHLMVLFSFEVDIYKNLGLDVTWVGHPLVDELKSDEDRDTFIRQWGLDKTKPLVSLAPGSRVSEVDRLLPAMAEVARQREDRYQFALPLAPSIERKHVEDILAGAPVAILPSQMRSLMRHADAAVVASGTATLETALLHTPMIVGYKMKNLSYWLARMLVRVPHIALANIVLDTRVAPELIQGDFKPELILPELDDMVTNGKRRDAMIAEYKRLDRILGGGGAAKKAAEVLKGFLK